METLSRRDDGGYGQRHVVHGHHQHAHGPIFKKNRTNLDTFAWYTGRLAIGVFDDARPGGPIEVLEVNGEPIEKMLSDRRSTDMPSRSAMSAFGGEADITISECHVCF
jgi:hypothetical protein